MDAVSALSGQSSRGCPLYQVSTHNMQGFIQDFCLEWEGKVMQGCMQKFFPRGANLGYKKGGGGQKLM